jgi:hypothetical protein
MKATPGHTGPHAPRTPQPTNRTTAPLLSWWASVTGWFSSPLDRAPRTSEPLELYRHRMRTAATYTGVDHA